jgi:hypothetical protein
MPTRCLPRNRLIAHPEWLSIEPVDLAAVDVTHEPPAPDPVLNGTELESSHVRPLAALVRPYQRYSHAIRELDRPKLFENRASWRLTDLGWAAGTGRMSFADTTYFCGLDMYEALAHEMALVHLDESSAVRPGRANMRDLPFRKLIGDPFDLGRRPVLPSISTLTIRRTARDASFILHQRDSNSVAVAGGMLQVIPSGVFQPSSVLPTAMRADFDLWRDIKREYSEELLGNPEHDGDGQPIRYDAELASGGRGYSPRTLGDSGMPGPKDTRRTPQAARPRGACATGSPFCPTASRTRNRSNDLRNTPEK